MSNVIIADIQAIEELDRKTLAAIRGGWFGLLTSIGGTAYSTYNESQTLASDVLKKRDDTANTIIGKI